MSLSKDFKTFCKNIHLNNLDDMQNTAKNLAKKIKQSLLWA